MEILQQFTKKKEEKSDSAPKNGISIETRNQSGVAYEDAKACGGRTPNLKASLETLYEQFFTKTKKDTFEQEKLKQPYLIEQESLRIKTSHTEEEIKTIKKTQEEAQSEINTLHQEGVMTINNQETLEKMKPQSNIKLWLGVFLIIPLSLYIGIFYISTAYSAFFKEFDPNVSLFQTIFEAQALTRAYEAGWMEAGFILLIPFVFFSLGYLIHMLWSQKKWSGYIKVALLFIITFSFDAILAYLIDQKEYNFNKTPDSPEFTLSGAFLDPTFWLIIFAGFVSYIVWGLVFDMIMIENSKRDALLYFRKNHTEKLQQKNKQLTKIQEKLEQAEEESDSNKVRLKELECIIDGFILPIQNYKVFAIEYLKGWQKYIAAELPIGQEQKTKLLNECSITYQSHIQALDLVADDYQNKVFTKAL
ncbi:hypothetical protein [Aquimarina sp. RZ0]|uniref:hypothetical protein n=1 Tax=Aquimarina sp. RZ0 TaxID=2607730 RepID=UPI0011F20C6F|nr:hypothetical protein [Aquimarina sp. RZ0]KAA1245870.1 hypothetical protein F0000_09940 [Aquimarina sp. RZ0]